MGRRRRNVYLGRKCRSKPCVPDTGKPGLSNLREVRGITKRIVSDYKRGRISKAKAQKRLNLLKLIVKKDPDFRGKVRKAWKIIEQARARLRK